MSRSAWTVWCSGATTACRAAALSPGDVTTGTDDPASSRAPEPSVIGTPAMTGAFPVDGRTLGRLSGVPVAAKSPCGGPLSTATRPPVTVPAAASMAMPADSIRRRPPLLMARASRRPALGQHIATLP